MVAIKDVQRIVRMVVKQAVDPGVLLTVQTPVVIAIVMPVVVQDVAELARILAVLVVPEIAVPAASAAAVAIPADIIAGLNVLYLAAMDAVAAALVAAA